MASKKATSFRLSKKATQILEDLSERLGLTQAGVVELALRRLEKIEETELPITKQEFEIQEASDETEDRERL